LSSLHSNVRERYHRSQRIAEISRGARLVISWLDLKTETGDGALHLPRICLGWGALRSLCMPTHLPRPRSQGLVACHGRCHDQPRLPWCSWHQDLPGDRTFISPDIAATWGNTSTATPLGTAQKLGSHQMRGVGFSRIPSTAGRRWALFHLKIKRLGTLHMHQVIPLKTLPEWNLGLSCCTFLYYS
jgi:hypothetical protein